MKFKFSLVIAIASFLSFAGTSHALFDSNNYSDHEDIKGRWGAGVQVSQAIAEADEVSISDNIGYSAGVTYGILDYLALHINMGYHELSYGAGSVDVGDLMTAPLMFDLQWRYPFDIGTMPVTVYGVTGIGILFHDFQAGEPVLAVNRDIKANDSLGLRFGLGFDFFLTRHWAANVEATYTWSTSGVHVAVPELGLGDNTVNADFFNVGGGLKYYF